MRTSRRDYRTTVIRIFYKEDQDEHPGPKKPARNGLLAMAVGVTLMSLSACSGSSAAAQDEEASSPDWDAVGEAIGKEGERMEGDVYRINLPRSDLSVTSRGVDIKPGLALGSYAAFKQTGDSEALVMGDLVLTEDEYNPVIDRLQEGASSRRRSTSIYVMSRPLSGGRTSTAEGTRLRWRRPSARRLI